MKGFSQAVWTHSDLFKAFEKFGVILSAKVSLDRNHVSKGFGYIQFENGEQAKRAMSEMHEHKLECGDSLTVTPYEPPERQAVPSTNSSGLIKGVFNNLYVKNFPSPDFDEAGLMVNIFIIQLYI